jgi:hypothetical protein
MKPFIFIITITFLLLSINKLCSQRLFEYKGINIYSSSQNPNQNILNWAFETIDTISNYTEWENSLNPEIDYFDYVKYIDEVFKNTSLSLYPNVLIILNCKGSYDWPCGPMVLIVEFPSEKKATINKSKIYKYFEHDWFDVATPYMTCTTKGNYLRLILFSGDPPDIPSEMLNYFKVTHY